MAKSPEDRAEEEYVLSLQWVMSDHLGRQFVHALIDRLGLLRSVFRSPSSAVRDAERLVFNGARQDFARELYVDATKYAPVESDRMQLEARERALLAKNQDKKKKDEEKPDGDAVDA